VRALEKVEYITQVRENERIRHPISEQTQSYRGNQVFQLLREYSRANGSFLEKH